MKSIIIGGGKVGYFLLKTLTEKKYDVVLIERDKNKCYQIADDLNAIIIHGDGTDLEVLNDAGIDEAEIIAAVTGNDEENFIICQIAKFHYNINKTIARINNPKNKCIFRELGVDLTVCSTEVIANLIESEFEKDHFKIIQTFERGNLILSEVIIEKSSPWCNKVIKELKLPRECVLVSIIRNEKIIYPNGNVIILENDRVLVTTNTDALVVLKNQFSNSKHRSTGLEMIL